MIVLRDHRLFNPLTPGHPLGIDVKQLEAEARKMVQPGQELIMVSGMHNLHDHEHLALAIGRAIESRSVPTHAHSAHAANHTGSADGGRLRARPFLDGKAIMNELHESADMLASGLVGLQVRNHNHPYLKIPSCVIFQSMYCKM
mgnify:CR=1 FL=1